VSRPAWYEFYWDEQDIYAETMEDPRATPWTFPEMLTRALELEDAEPKHHNLVDGKFVPDRSELNRLRFCIDDRLRSAARAVITLRWPTNSARHLTGPWYVSSITGPRWAHLER
jgi:hypothetical protein